jgi:hypothetical protein
VLDGRVLVTTSTPARAVLFQHRHPNEEHTMKKNENVSKKAATMMKKLRKDELEAAAGGGRKPGDPCWACGLVASGGI